MSLGGGGGHGGGYGGGYASAPLPSATPPSSAAPVTPQSASAGAASDPSAAATSAAATAAYERLLAAIGGSDGGVSRSTVFELLRLAFDPGAAQTGVAWAGSWSQASSSVSKAHFHMACSRLHTILATGAIADKPPSNGLGASHPIADAPPPPPPPKFTVHNPPPPPPPLPAAMPWGEEAAKQYKLIYDSLNNGQPVTRPLVQTTMQRANLPPHEVDVVWALCDLNARGVLDLEEFTIALHLAAERFKGQPLPESIPPSWLSGAKRAALARPSPAGGYGGYGGGLLPPAPPAGGFGGGGSGGGGLLPPHSGIDGGAGGAGAEAAGDDDDDDDDLNEKKKKGGFFGRKSKPKAPKETKDKGKDATGAGGGFVPPTLAPPGDGFGSASGGLLPPLPAGGGSAFGFIGGNGGEPAHPGGFGGGQWGAPPLEAPGFGSIQGPMSVRLPGAPAQKPMSAPEQAADWGGMSRSGLLQCELAGKKKPRWVVLGAGSVAIYGDKKDFSDAKPPKATLDVRREVQRVMCSSMSSFAIILKEDVKAPGAKPKDKPIAKAGESIKFESDDSKELTAWVTDITAVWRAGQQF
jgi:hypothetical protein